MANRFASVLLCAALMLIQIRPQVAQAQTIGDDEIQNYARAVVDIEPVRLQAFDEATDVLASDGSDLSVLDITLSCLRTRMRDMPDLSRTARIELRTVLVTYCNKAQTIAEVNDLTPKRFNAITAELKSDESLADRIKSAIREL